MLGTLSTFVTLGGRGKHQFGTKLAPAILASVTLGGRDKRDYWIRTAGAFLFSVTLGGRDKQTSIWD